MSILERLALPLFHCFDPEMAHRLGLQALKSGLVRLPGPVTSPRLQTDLAGLNLPNPVGLAAGFDKNAEAVGPLSLAGFGFLEVGAATPKAQPGNPKPRLFRLTEDHAAINRFGFNNEGMGKICTRLARRSAGIPVGLNLGANKDSQDRAADYASVLKNCGPFIDFATVNVSSPNTKNLRDLQDQAALSVVLERVMDARAELSKPVPVFLKISPDLHNDQIAAIGEVAISHQIDAIIATNTTLERKGLQSPYGTQDGGLSGAPLFEKSTRVLAQLSRATHGAMPLIGVGGIGSAQQAYQKICAGASAVQFYTAMVFQGMSFVHKLTRGLDELLAQNGHGSVREATGTERDLWL